MTTTRVQIPSSLAFTLLPLALGLPFVGGCSTSADEGPEDAAVGDDAGEHDTAEGEVGGDDAGGDDAGGDDAGGDEPGGGSGGGGNGTTHEMLSVQGIYDYVLEHDIGNVSDLLAALPPPWEGVLC